MIPHILGIIAAPICLFWLDNVMVIRLLEILLGVVVLSGIGLLAQYSLFRKKGWITEKLKFTTPLYITYNVFGVGFLGVLLLAIVNLSFGSDEVQTESFKVVGMDPDYQIYRWGDCVYLLEDDTYSHDVNLRAHTYNKWDLYRDNPNDTYMEYQFKQGLLGVKIKVDHKIVVNKEPLQHQVYSPGLQASHVILRRC